MFIAALTDYLMQRIWPLVSYLIEKGFHEPSHTFTEGELRSLAGLLAAHLLSENPIPFDHKRLQVLLGPGAHLWDEKKYHLPSLMATHPDLTIDQLLAKACTGFLAGADLPWPIGFHSLGNTLARGLVAYYLEFKGQQLRYAKVPLCRDLCKCQREVDIHGDCHNQDRDSNNRACRSVIDESLWFFGEDMRIDAKVRMCPACDKLVPNPTGRAGALCSFCDSATVGKPHTYWFPRNAVPLDQIVPTQNNTTELDAAMDMLVQTTPEYRAHRDAFIIIYDRFDVRSEEGIKSAKQYLHANGLTYTTLHQFVTKAKNLTSLLVELEQLAGEPGELADHATHLLKRGRLAPKDLQALDDELEGRLDPFYAVFGQ